MSYLRTSFLLSFVLVFSFVVNVHWANASDLVGSQNLLGIQPVGEYAKVDLAVTPNGTAIPGTMIDSSNTEGYASRDLGSQINLGNDQFKTDRLADAANPKFSSNRENGRVELAQSDGSNQGFADAQNYDEDLKGRFGVGIRGSYVKYQNDHNIKPEYSLWLGVNLTYFLNNYTSFELSADNTKTDVNSGKLSQVPLLIGGRLHSWLSDKFTPYFDGGVAYFFNDFDSNSNATVKVYDAWGFFLGTGAEYFFTRNASFNVDLKYIWDKVKAKVNSTKEYWHINPIVIGVGIKYYF